jgi:heptosyltransferase-2
VHCEDCPHYQATDLNILIIKLGAIGDVIRTTPLLRKLRCEYPLARIWWLTHTPDILPPDVDVALKFTLESIIGLHAIEFDILINLDKDREACGLADRIEAGVKKGFTIRNGACAPIDEDAEAKFLSGVFDDVNKANTKSYVEESFEICGFKWTGEEYMLDVPADGGFDVPHGRPVVGLNTGCGGRWTSRLWPEDSWAELIQLLAEAGCTPLLLGGEQEHEKNTRLAGRTGAMYLGHFPLKRFIALMNECDVIVSAVTMAMHIAIGLRKPLILFNNIFNPHEFELYGRGEIVAPGKECRCYFRPTCVNDEYKCMDSIEPVRVIDAVRRWIPGGQYAGRT